MRVAFAGTPAFARQALAAIHAAGYPVPLVLAQPDRPAGRGMKLQAAPVKAFALEHAIPLLQPAGLRLDGRFGAEAAAVRDALQQAGPDVLVVAAYGLILPQWVLQLPRLGCINIHASLLPRWRGAAPVQRAIEAGDPETGVSIMQMDAGLDTGAVLQVERLWIGADETAAGLTDRLGELGGRLMVDVLGRLAEGPLVATPQPDEGVTYASKVLKTEAPIDWHADAVTIERRIRAFDPFPGATLSLDGETVKCWRAGLVAAAGAESGADARPGTVLAVDPRGIVVACGRGSLCLTELQRPGGRRLGAREFLQRGAPAPGSRLDASDRSGTAAPGEQPAT